MDERTARAVVLARAIETADAGRQVWSDDDRAWAGRTAAEIVGATASDAAFVAARASLSLQRLAARHPKIATLSQAAVTPRGLATLFALAAFVVGALGVEIGPAHQINLLAPPVLALLAWNLAVYAALIVAALSSRNGARAERPLRTRAARWLARITRPAESSNVAGPLVAALARFSADWTRLAAPLWQQRAARLLHVCAATLAAGAIAGLYLRGIALEYRAAWQSTFFDVGDVARLLRIVLAPGSWLTGIPVPGAARLESLGAGSAGENAAPWIHLYAATVLLVVIVPRLALAAVAALRERSLATRFPLALDGAYFQRVLRGWHEGAARIAAVAYSYAIAPANAEGFARVMARVFPSAVDVGWMPPVPYGSDDLPALPSSALAAIVVVFNASATPERENHGAFVMALAALVAARAPLVVIVDTSQFTDRFADQPARVAEREASWRQTLAEHGREAVFVRLAAPDVTVAAHAVTTRIEEAAS